MIISTVFNNISNLKNIDALIAEYSNRISNNQSVKNIHHPIELENMFYNAIVANNDDDIIKYGRMLSQYQSSDLCSGNPVRSLKNNIIGSCAVLTRYAISGGVNERVSFSLSDKYVNLAEDANSLEELMSLCNLMHLEYIREMKKAHKQDIYSKPINHAINYINSHFDEKISLKIVAKHTMLNDKYLSRLFKKETGISMVKYINSKKISYAKYLFSYTDMNILDISIELGFNSQEYFSKVFKDVEGISPKEYKSKFMT